MKTERTYLEEHYDYLKVTNHGRWSAMNVHLAGFTMARNSDGLTYFKRSILSRERENKDFVDLRYTYWLIVEAMKTYFGFSEADILANTVPPLPEPILALE